MESRHKSGLHTIPSPPMPSASGPECVRVLLAFGWTAVHWSEEECFLHNGRFAVQVPLDSRLAPERVLEIVRLAGVAPLAFVEGLERIRTQQISAYASLRSSAGSRSSR